VKENSSKMRINFGDGPSKRALRVKRQMRYRGYRGFSPTGSTAALLLAGLALAGLGSGCGDSPISNSGTQTQAKPTGPVIPDEIQKAAEKLLGSETQVLLFGDLANTGKQQFLAANVLPKTPTNTIPGTVVSRATIAEKEEDGQWLEIFHGDEHLKNTKGYLALTPLESVSSWRLQFEQDPDKGLFLYLTPVKMGSAQHVLPIGIRWNVATRRYQSLDQSYQHFLNEAPSLEDPRSVLR
jgi:hypothetical protein